MKKLTRSAFEKARDFLRAHGRPLEQARFAHEFEGTPVAPALAALAAFRNADGGFGHSLEPDLRMPASSVLDAATALDILRELGASDSEPLVRSAIAWLVERFDPEIPGWRCVPENVDEFPHAPHWTWELHKTGGPWPHATIPGAWLLFHLSHWRALVPRSVLESVDRATRSYLEGLTGDVGGDTMFYSARVATGNGAERLRRIAVEQVSRDPATWTTYCNKPLKLAPTPDAPLAECLVSETAANLDWEIDHQQPDGSWLPNWDWQGRHAAEWERARREWQGELTLRTLQSLRAYRRLESVPQLGDLA